MTKEPASDRSPDRGMVTTDPANATPAFSGPPREIAPGVLMVALFANVYAVKTSAGLLLIDSGTRPAAANLREAVRAWTSDPLDTVVYTHGHLDHVHGVQAFRAAGDGPRHIVAQENVVARFHRYRLTQGLNQSINARQFGNAEHRFHVDFEFPTLTYRDRLVQRIGDTEVVYTAGKGETDDHTYVWLPERRMLFTGDFIIWRAPNCGNPQKVQRFPVEWAQALEAMAGLEPEWLCPGHGPVIEGRDAVRLVLTETARYLRHIIDQVLPRLNAGETPEAIYHAVTSDPKLAARPYLNELYDHPKFIVRNLIRQWGGWWNGNPADLLPATPAAQATEIAGLAGGVPALIARARGLLAEGRMDLALHVTEWAIGAAPTDPAVLALERDAYGAALEASNNLMAQGVYRDAMNTALAALGEPTRQRRGRPLG